MFLALLWGPTLLVLGLAFLTSPKYYKRLYTDLDKNPITLLTLSMLLIPLGVTQVAFHNVWSSFPEILISFLGWGTIAKGVVIAVFPKLVDRAGDYEVRNGFLPVAGILMVIIGGYLTWFALF